MTRRVLITDADTFLGPGAVQRFRDGGDDELALSEPLTSRAQTRSLICNEGPSDVVIANLESPITVATVGEHTDEDVKRLFCGMADPLFWLFDAALPSMIERGAGAIVVPTSATVQRASGHPISGYVAARAAQTALVRSVAREVAKSGVRVNAVAPNFIENPAYFPPETVNDPDF